jgi:hypothetical protein
MAGCSGPWRELLVAAGQAPSSGRRTPACRWSICADVWTSHAPHFLRQQLEAVSRPRKSFLGEKIRAAREFAEKYMVDSLSARSEFIDYLQQPKWNYIPNKTELADMTDLSFNESDIIRRRSSGPA